MKLISFVDDFCCLCEFQCCDGLTATKLCAHNHITLQLLAQQTVPESYMCIHIIFGCTLKLLWKILVFVSRSMLVAALSRATCTTGLNVQLHFAHIDRFCKKVIVFETKIPLAWRNVARSLSFVLSVVSL